MRVLILSHMYPNVKSPLGGIFVQKQAEALAKAGLELAVIAPVPWVPGFFKGKGRWGEYLSVPLKEKGQPFDVLHPRVLQFPRNLFFDYYPWTYEKGIHKVAAQEAEKGFDLIHAHVAHPDGAAAVRLGKKYSVPVVVTIHGQDFAHTLTRSPKSAQIVKETLKQAAAVIVVSSKLKNHYDLEHWADDLSKYHIIYNGVSLDDVSVQSSAESPADSIADDSSYPSDVSTPFSRRTLLSVGFLRVFKGHAYVLEAVGKLVSEFPDLLYRIAGDGPERQNLEEKVKALGLENHVEFLGSLPHPEAMKQMGECDIFVLPSWNEAFGVVYLEAMAHGKPVIGSRGEGISDILENYDVGYAVQPRDSEEVAEALRKLLNNPEKAREKGLRGKQLVNEQFTWDYNARQMIDLYKKVLKG